jgi:hypothetical protein
MKQAELTVGRIDAWFTVAQQAAYLAVVGFALTQVLLEEGAPPREGWWFRWRSAVVHFLLGALLNLYAIFFFKSSSLLVSFSFLAFLLLLVLANEMPRFKALGLPFKFALLGLCLLCFAAAVVPIFVGSIGLGVFLLSMLAGAAPLAALGWRLRARGARRAILVPLGLVLLGFLTAYLFRVIPPVPLSIPYIVAHSLLDRAGVDLLHGHSSHHVKGIEVHRGKLILYGCGDFLNDYEGIEGYGEYRGDLSLMYFPVLDAENGQLRRLLAMPTCTRRFRVNRATPEQTDWLYATLNREGRKLGTAVERHPDGGLRLTWS